MSALQLPGVATDPDPLRRGVRAAWRHAPWAILGSALWTAGAVVALRTAGGSAAVAAVLAAVLTIPGVCLLVLLADRLVLDADFDARALRGANPRRLFRIVAVALVPVTALSMLTAIVLAYPYVPVLVGSIGLTAAAAVTLAATLLAPVVLALAVRRPDAPWGRLWLVASLATARRPVPVLGAWVAVIALGLLAWHLQILLLVAPGLAATALTAGAWAALQSLGIDPYRSPLGEPSSRQPALHSSGPAPHDPTPVRDRAERGRG